MGVATAGVVKRRRHERNIWRHRKAWHRQRQRSWRRGALLKNGHISIAASRHNAPARMAGQRSRRCLSMGASYARACCLHSFLPATCGKRYASYQRWIARTARGRVKQKWRSVCLGGGHRWQARVLKITRRGIEQACISPHTRNSRSGVAAHRARAVGSDHLLGGTSRP